MTNAIIINGQFHQLDNVDLHDIELALLKAQKDWNEGNATVPAKRVQKILDAITEADAAYWQADNGFGQTRFKA